MGGIEHGTVESVDVEASSIVYAILLLATMAYMMVRRRAA